MTRRIRLKDYSQTERDFSQARELLYQANVRVEQWLEDNPRQLLPREGLDAVQRQLECSFTRERLVNERDRLKLLAAQVALKLPRASKQDLDEQVDELIHDRLRQLGAGAIRQLADAIERETIDVTQPQAQEQASESDNDDEGVDGER
jgi:hypothetical protein